jgi:hypothetical protein
VEQESKPSRPRGAAIAAVAALVTTLTLFLPSTAYLTNSAELSITYADVLASGLCLSVALGALLWLGLVVLDRVAPAWRVRALSLLCGLAVLVWLQGNFLLWPYGPLDGREIPWPAMRTYGYVDGAVWLAAAVAALASSRRLARAAPRVGVLLMLTQLAYCGVLLSSQPEVPSFKRYTADERNRFVFSPERNVVLIVLDSFPTDVFAEIARQSPRLARAFDGFTHYRNAVGSFPYTELSVASILTGRCYDNSVPVEQWRREAYGSGSLPRVLKAAGWRVDLFPLLGYSLYYSEDVASNFVPGLPFRRRLPDLALVYDIALFRAVPHFLRERVYDDRKWVISPLVGSAAGERASSPGPDAPAASGTVSSGRHRFPPGAYASADVRFIDDALSQSVLGEARSAFKFYHLRAPHPPLVLDEKLEFAPMAVNRDNYERYATAALELLALFLDRLRELGIYDETLVFVLGDHGAGNLDVPFVLQPGMPLDEGARTVRIAFRVAALPLVLFKPFGGRGPLRASDAPVSLIDVAPTVLASVGITPPAGGRPLPSIGESERRERRFFTYDGRDARYYGRMREHLVDGYAWQRTSWRLSGRVFTKDGVAWIRPRVGSETPSR